MHVCSLVCVHVGVFTCTRVWTYVCVAARGCVCRYRQEELREGLRHLTSHHWHELPPGDAADACDAAGAGATYLSRVGPLVALYARPAAESVAAFLALRTLLCEPLRALPGIDTGGDGGPVSAAELVARVGPMVGLPHHASSPEEVEGLLLVRSAARGPPPQRASSRTARTHVVVPGPSPFVGSVACEDVRACGVRFRQRVCFPFCRPSGAARAYVWWGLPLAPVCLTCGA